MVLPDIIDLELDIVLLQISIIFLQIVVVLYNMCENCFVYNPLL